MQEINNCILVTDWNILELILKIHLFQIILVLNG